MAIIYNSYYHIVSHAGNGNCLNVYGNNTIQNNNRVCLWAWDDEPAQLWKVVTNSSGFKILSGISDTYGLNCSQSGSNSACDCDVYPAADNIYSFVTFYIVDLSKNIFRIKNTETDLFLTVHDTDNNTTVRWESSTGEDNQKWRLCTEDDFTYSKGADTATIVNSSALKTFADNDISFVCRYLRRTVTSSLSPTERDLIHSHGLDIVCFFQYSSNTASYFTEANAELDANAALVDAEVLNMPDGAAIYFAVDYDASTTDINNKIIPYFRKIAEVFAANEAPYRIGVYGSGLVCKTLKDTNNIAELTFLCGSTGYQGRSSYNSLTRFDVRQIAPSTTLGGISIDYDETWKTDFGQW